MPGMADRGGSVKRMREREETEGGTETRDGPEDGLCIATSDEDLQAAWETAITIETSTREWEGGAEFSV